jgi:hypothetical protein
MSLVAHWSTPSIALVLARHTLLPTHVERPQLTLPRDTSLNGRCDVTRRG